jgi:uncharacterized damage-inducible protein DinB
MTIPGMKGIVTGKWKRPEELPHHLRIPKPTTKKELLRRWDEATDELNELWAQVTPQRFEEIDKAFEQWEGPVYFFILYWIDNEIHHRGQAYVYLRSLGIEPPHFWERQ